MNKIIIIVGLMVGIFSLQGQNYNGLVKIFHHKGMMSDNIVCYLTKDPVCNKLITRNNAALVDNNLRALTLFLPMTQFDGSEVREMLKKVENKSHENYSIKIQEVKAPIKGVKVMISYNPDKIICDYKTFDAISGNKGIVFSFHNKNMLEKLKNNTDPLALYAQNMKGRKPKVMLDFGHGGSDDGKVGCFNIKEKTINFEIGMRVAKLLKDLGCEVLLTRYGDYFVALDERTSLTNKKKADLFLSLHANSGPSEKVSGIETYWLDSTLLRNGEAHHDSLSKFVSLHDTLSERLAQAVHSSVIDSLTKPYAIHDRKVKKSVTQVLLGTDLMIPSTLIEMGFLSNQEETKLLTNKTYQTKIAHAIAQGVMSYLAQASKLS